MAGVWDTAAKLGAPCLAFETWVYDGAMRNGMMKAVRAVFFLLSAAGVLTQPLWSASPCDNVDRSLTDNTKGTLAPVIAKQLHTQKVDVLQSFRLEGWTIIYVNSHDADESFLFYPHDPVHSRYVTRWGGAAAWNEEQSIKSWTLKNAPGIPPKLASCFAWHVTSDRDK